MAREAAEPWLSSHVVKQSELSCVAPHIDCLVDYIFWDKGQQSSSPTTGSLSESRPNLGDTYDQLISPVEPLLSFGYDSSTTASVTAIPFLPPSEDWGARECPEELAKAMC